jgi:HK97 family phage major capsid protein
VAEEKVKTAEELAKDINKSIETLKSSIEEKADLSVLEDRLGAVTAKFEKLLDKDGNILKPDYVTKQQEQLDDISTQLKQLGEYQKGKGESISEQVLKALKSDDFKAKMKTPAGVRTGGLDFEIKAANIDTADINSGTIETQTDIGVSAAPWRNTPIWDNISKGVVGPGRDSISWWEETSRTDSAEAVAEEAGPSSGSAKTWTKQSMNIMRMADFTKATREALGDFEYINSEVQDLIQNGIPRYREGQLLSGAGTTVYPKGLTQYAKAFAKPSNFNAVSESNEGDVLAAAILQANNGNTSDSNKKGYMPNVIMLNPGDSINMRLLKNSLYSYLQHPLLSPDGSKFKGIQIVENLDMTAGTFLVGDFARAKAYVKRNMQISFHYENEDDVKNDLVLVMATMRLAGLKISAADAYGFVYGTFSSAKELILETVA